MPIFEYHCKQCGTHFDELVRNARDEEDIICPKCKGKEVEKLFSAFGFRSGSKAVSSVAGSGDSCRTCATKTCSTCG